MYSAHLSLRYICLARGSSLPLSRSPPKGNQILLGDKNKWQTRFQYLEMFGRRWAVIPLPAFYMNRFLCRRMGRDARKSDNGPLQDGEFSSDFNINEVEVALDKNPECDRQSCWPGGQILYTSPWIKLCVDSRRSSYAREMKIWRWDIFRIIFTL